MGPVLEVHALVIGKRYWGKNVGVFRLWRPGFLVFEGAGDRIHVLLMLTVIVIIEHVMIAWQVV